MVVNNNKHVLICQKATSQANQQANNETQYHEHLYFNLMKTLLFNIYRPFSTINVDIVYTKGNSPNILKTLLFVYTFGFVIPKEA